MVCEPMAPLRQPPLQRRPDAGYAPQRHHLYELGVTGGGNQQHAIRLRIRRRHFRDQLVRGDAHRTGHMEPRGDLLSYPGADPGRPLPGEQRPRHVHIRLIHRNLLEPVSDLAEHPFDDAPRHHPVVVHVHRQEHAVRAQLTGAGARHRRIDAVTPCLIARRRHHRARPGADDHRLAFEFGMTCHFQRGVEGVHVDVQHRAAGLVMPPIAFGGGQSRCGAHIPYRTVPCRAGMERALPYRWGAAVAISLPPARGLACRSAGRREIAGVALVIVAVIVTFTGDSNPAR